MFPLARRALTAVVLAAAATGALAATASPAFAIGPSTVTKSGNILVVTASPGSPNTYRISEDAKAMAIAIDDASGRRVWGLRYGYLSQESANKAALEECQDSAKARGIAVANMPGTNSQAVAEMTLMLMLATLRRATYFDPLTRRGEGWRPDLSMLDGVGEIAGRTVGFFGYGAVPSRLTPALQALGAQVVYHARSPKPDAAARYVDFEELLAVSDILSLNAPATDQTRGHGTHSRPVVWGKYLEELLKATERK